MNGDANQPTNQVNMEQYAFCIARQQKVEICRLWRVQREINFWQRLTNGCDSPPPPLFVQNPNPKYVLFFIKSRFFRDIKTPFCLICPLLCIFGPYLVFLGLKIPFLPLTERGGGGRKVVGKHLIKSLIFVYLWVRLPELYFPILTLKGVLGFEITFFFLIYQKTTSVPHLHFFWSGMAPNGQERPIWTEKFGYLGPKVNLF